MGTLAYLAFVLATIVGPGVAAQRVLRLRVDTALVLPLGLAFCAAASWLSLIADLPWLFPGLVALALVAVLARRERWRVADGPSLPGAVAAWLAVIALLCLVQYPFNRRSAQGDFLLDDLERIDTAFHVGVTWELATGYPPQVPGLAGVPLGYHVGPHLIRAAALRWAHVHPYDALYRFDVTLWALALILALRAMAAAMGASPRVVALIGWSLLATDFSFCFAADPGARWWTELLRGNLLLSLVFANSVVPALALAMGSLVALRRFLLGEGRGWLVLAGALGAALPFFKVFLAAQLLLGLGVALLLSGRRAPLVAVAVPCLAASVCLALGQAGRNVEVLLVPLAPAALTRDMLGRPALAGVPFIAWSALWLVASLGLRTLGVPRAYRALRSRDAPRVALAAVALSGWPLALLLRVTADGVFNESVYFTVQSGALLWIFTCEALVALLARGLSVWLIGVASVSLAVPSSVEFVWRKARTPPDVVPARVLRAMSALEQASRPGDVVLMRPFSRYPPPPIVFIGRRVAYTDYMPYLQQFASAKLLRERRELVRRFFRTSDASEALAIARGLGARFVYLFGPQAIGVDPETVLEPVYVEGNARVYRIPTEDARRP